jgi:hypothetical protein
MMSISLNGANGQNGSNGHSGVNHGSNGASREPADLQMDQIRDLLLGQLKVELANRFAAIEERLATLERNLAAARTDDETKRKAGYDALAKGVAALSEHVQQMAKS